MEIIPTIFEKEIDQVENRITGLKDFTRWFQVDVSDGTLTKGSSFSLELLPKIDQNINLNKHLFDIHLMVKEPLKWIKKCLSVQASRIYGQVEMMSDRCQFITEAKNNGLEVGLAFDLSTPIDSDIPPETDIILLMGRNMGFDSSPFDFSVFPKIDFIKERGFKVAVDGGVTPQLLSKLQEHGVDVVYSGQYFLNLINEKIF